MGEIWADVAVLTLIYAVYGMSLTLVIGYTGIPAVAPTAFGAIGGYATAWFTLSEGINAYLSVLIGIAITTLFSLVISDFVLRLSAIYVILLTVALGTLVVGVIPQINALGGPYGLTNVPIPGFFGLRMNRPSDFIPVAAVLTAIAYVLVRRVGSSNFGLVLRAIRNDETAVRAAGFNPTPSKVAVFAMSSAFAAAAGGALVIYNQVVTPTSFSFTEAMLIVAVAMIGGVARPVGVVVGAVFIQVVPTLLQQYVHLAPERASLVQQIVFGVVLVTVMVIRPSGIFLEGVSRISRRVAAQPAATEDERESLIGSVERRDAVPAEVLRADGISKSFGGVVAANGFSFRLTEGLVVGLVGPNGAGKTTLFNLLTNALRKDAGEVVVYDRDVTNTRMDRIVGVGMARSFQDIRLWGDLSVAENVLLGALDPRDAKIASLLPGRATRDRTREAIRRTAGWLTEIQLSQKALVPSRDLSYGEQKLVGIARLLATDAPIVLLDEPAAGVGPEIAQRILDQIRDLARHGKTVLLVEHNLEIVKEVATWCYFMEQGSIRLEGTYDELVNNPDLADSYFGPPAELEVTTGTEQ